MKGINIIIIGTCAKASLATDTVGFNAKHFANANTASDSSLRPISAFPRHWYPCNKKDEVGLNPQPADKAVIVFFNIVS